MKKFFRTFIMMLSMLGISSGASASVGIATAANIQSALKNDPKGTMVLDVRTPGEWSRGHIKGSILIPIRMVSNSLARIPKDKNIIIVCATGARSGAVAKFLDGQGYPSVMNYTGGLVDWARKGYPLVR